MANAMASISAPVFQDQDRLALVSSLYGPGSVACWYLTIISLLVTWTFHPRKRTSGSVEVDLIAVLTPVIVASGHFATQIQTLLVQSGRASSNIDGSHVQLVAALEAPCVIVNASSPIIAILGFMAIHIETKRRHTLIHGVGLLSFTGWCYIYSSGFAELSLTYDPMMPYTHDRPKFSRFLTVNFPHITIGIMMTLLVIFLVQATMHLLVPNLCWTPFPSAARHISEMQRRPQVQTASSGREGRETRSIQEPQRLRTWQKKMVVESSAFAMCLLVVIAVFVQFFVMLHLSSINHDSVVSAQTRRQKLKQYTACMFSNLFPESSYSIMDLDQAVTLTAGVSILAFRIYGVAKARFEIWKNKATLPVASPSPTVMTSELENNAIELESQSSQ